MGSTRGTPAGARGMASGGSPTLKCRRKVATASAVRSGSSSCTA